MEWLEIIGSLLAFVGSIVVSSDIVQSKRYADAQSHTYLSGNPFTLRSNKTNAIGFLLIVLGFSITLSVNISSAASLNTSDTTSILVGFGVTGILMIALLYLRNERLYEKIEAERQLTIFISAVSNIKTKFESIIGQHNERELFPIYKQGDIDALENYYENLNENQKSQDVIDVFNKLSRARTTRGIVRTATEYTRNTSSRN